MLLDLVVQELGNIPPTNDKPITAISKAKVSSTLVKDKVAKLFSTKTKEKIICNKCQSSK